MQFSDPRLDHVFDPLKVVDVKTLASMAASLKNSKNKSKRAIGVFLDRVNRMRTDENQPKGQAPKKTSSPLMNRSGLKDLRD
ncbi:MAG: hypothetical protein HN368_09340 [Spirochaetales bacterium]|jgi:hypothetical protein|nr:hypothetical protein [Spirochaetales bacterium]